MFGALSSRTDYQKLAQKKEQDLAKKADVAPLVQGNTQGLLDNPVVQKQVQVEKPGV